ncbi:MAG: CoA transferase [Candidatus Bathyarchaeota archaeon]|nr:CoA transferase [Candidatus Bathyarchaeota archaeon]
MGMLNDIKILDFSHVYFGPYATMVMADMGAEVLKIEPPWGELARLYPPHFGGVSSVFHYLDRNKKSISLNLKDPKAKEIVLELVKQCDVVVENFKRGTMEKLGLGYEDIKKVKPDIIYASLSGFGLDGPYKDRPSFAPIAGSYTGWYRLTGDNVDPKGPPIVPAAWHGDLDPGLWAVIGVLGAIRHRDKTGEGQLIDVSQIDCMLAQTGVQITGYTLSGKLPYERSLERIMGPTTFGVFEASDGYVYIAADPNMHQRLMMALGVDDLGEGRTVLDNWVKDRTVQECVDGIVPYSIPVAPILQIDQTLEDPHVKARGTIVEVEHKTAGKVTMPGFPLKMSATPGEIKYAAPLLGEHTAEVLKDLLGYSDEEIETLRKAAIITVA